MPTNFGATGANEKVYHFGYYANESLSHFIYERSKTCNPSFISLELLLINVWSIDSGNQDDFM